MRIRYSSVLSVSILNVILLFSLSVSVYGNVYNTYYGQASPIRAETPKVILQQGTAGTSTIYTNNTSAKVAVNTTAWLSGWSYRKSHEIYNATGAGTNYQIKITVINGTGTDSGDTVYINNKTRSDFGDIRFVNTTDNGVYDYWMEELNEGENATFWVEIGEDLSNTNRTIYMYYGNSGATTTSNVTNTFIRVIDGAQPLKLSFPMDEGSSTTAYDKSGNGNNGTLQNGPTWVNGKFGKALSFDGSNDYVDCGNDSSLNPSNITMEAWAKANSLSNWAGIVTNKKDANHGINLQMGTVQNIAALVGDGSSWVYVKTSWAPSTGVWYHIVVTHEGTTNKLYVNGNLEDTKTKGLAYSTPTTKTVIGYFYYDTSGSLPFNGTIDEVRIYNRALTADEIADLYSYYPFESSSLSGQTLIRKYVSPEPTHGDWGSEEAAWLTGWSYRKSHVINNATEAGTNYQIEITAHYGSGTDSGADVYLNSHCRTDFGDVRFTDDDGTTLLDYWLESKVDSDHAIFWVEVADDLSTNPAAIYIYYGNPTATTTSNGDSTFVFFDDFLGTSLDTTKWNSPHFADAGTSLSVHDGLLDFNVLAGYAHTGGCVISLNTLPPGNFVCQSRVKFINYYQSALGAYAGFTDAVAYDDAYYGNPSKLASARLWDYTNKGWYLLAEENSIGSLYSTTQITIRSLWFRMQTIYTPSTYIKGVWNQLESPFASQTLEKSGTGGLTPNYVAVGIGDYNTAEHTYFDYVFIRKYVSPEPSDGAWGSEESGQTFDYVLKVANQASDNWNIRFRAYNQTNIGRLFNCTIFFHNGGGVSRQISIYNGTCEQQFGNWYDLNGLSTVYIGMTVSATANGTSLVYAYLEVLVPGTSTYNLMVITFEIL